MGDTTERIEAEQPLGEGESGLRALADQLRVEERLKIAALAFETAAEGIVVCDENNNIISVNPAFEQITGYTAQEVVGRNPSLLKSGVHDAAFYRTLWQAINEGGSWRGELWDRRKNGEIYAQRMSISTIRGESGQVRRYLALVSDITLEKLQAEAVAHQAAHDPLTGLPNRRLFLERLDQAIARANREQNAFGLLMVDLDGFKDINDSFGHKAGDQLLAAVGERIVAIVRESDTVARLGGDEFTVLVEGVTSARDVQVVAQKLVDTVRKPYRIDGAELQVSASVGIALFPGDGHDSDGLMRNADRAMYRAKEDGRNAFRFFTAEMQALAVARSRMENDLRRAIRESEFRLHYQPLVELDSGKVAGAEALVRWQPPGGEVLSASEFLPLAESSGLIDSIGEWVIRTAVEQAAAWRERVAKGFRVAINLSSYQFQRARHREIIEAALSAHGLSGDALSMEIGEALLLDERPSTREQLDDLRRQGISLVVDHFGTGYSSLSCLNRRRVDRVKIDRGLVRAIGQDEASTTLIEAVLLLGHAFGLEVVAEGVENVEQAGYLQQRGCRYAQGELFGAPLAAGEFAARFLKLVD